MKKIILISLFILLAYLSLILRGVEVANKNPLFLFDQGRDYLAVKNIVVDHKLTLIGSEIGAGVAGFRGIFHGPFYYYFLAIPFIVFNGDPYGGVVLMFSFGILAIILSFYLGKKLFGTFGGVIVALLAAVCPPLISQSRFVWNSHPTSSFILFVFIFLYLFLKNRKNKYLFLASFFSGFIYNFELAIAIPMVITLILFSLFILKLCIVKQYLLIISGLLSSFSPMIFFEAKHDFMAINGMRDYFLHNEKTGITPKFIELLTKDHLTSFWFNFLVTFPKQNVISSIFIFLIIFVPVIYFLLKEKNNVLKKFIFYLLILIPVNFIIFSPLRNAVYTYYLIDLNLAYILLFSYAIYAAYTRKHALFKFVLTFFLVILMFYAVKDYTPNARNDYFDYGGTAKVKGKIDAIDYIYKDAGSEKFGLLVFSPPVYTYPYDYLIWWYGEKKYGYIPYKEKKGLFYLLIEKDLGKPWSYEGWLKTVIKTGKVLETKTLPSGFIIQKRIEEKNEI